MCRYNRVLKPERRRGTWLKEEDDALRFAVAAYAHVKGGGGGGAGAVGAELDAGGEREDGAAGGSAAGTGAGAGAAGVKTGDGVVLPWSKIAAHVATRTDVQCRERWINVLDPEVVKSANMVGLYSC